VTGVNGKIKLSDEKKSSDLSNRSWQSVMLVKLEECDKILKMWNWLDCSNGSVTRKLRQQTSDGVGFDL